MESANLELVVPATSDEHVAVAREELERHHFVGVAVARLNTVATEAVKRLH